MEPPPQAVPLPPHTVVDAVSHQLNCSGSAESSPRSMHHHAEWDEPLPPVPGAKLRFMCSYGGHIIPRPHDKTLCYVGGDTRMVVVDRNSSLSDLHSRLSKSLLDGRKFALKYQLPNEDLDSLISVTTDEDLESLIEEYDRITAVNSSLKPLARRLRLFLFLAKPETAKTMGALLDDSKSATWFVDALNGANVLPRGLSESAAIDDLLSLDSGITDPGPQVPAGLVDVGAQSKIASQDVDLVKSTMVESYMVENISSLDSSTSSPAMAHVSPIRVDESSGDATRLLTEDQIKGGGDLENYLSSQLRLTPPLIPTPNMTPAVINNNNYETNLNRVVVCDDERSSDHNGLFVAITSKPPLPLSLQPRNCGGFNLVSPDSMHIGGFNLPSPDSVTSDSSITSATSFSKVPHHQIQDPTQVITMIDTKLPLTKPELNPKTDNSTLTTPNKTGQIQDPNNIYIYPPQLQQQDQHQPQYIQTNMHYVPTHARMTSPYYPIYAPQVDPHQQYPVYLIPAGNQTQSYSTTAQAHSLVGGNYGNYDHHQVYYTQQLASVAPMAASQYQSITPAQAAMIAEASMQLPITDCSKQSPRKS